MELHKEAVVGFVISKIDGELIVHTPIIVGWEGFDDAIALDRSLDEEYLSTIPAQPGTFAVYGYDDLHPDMIHLGYEYPGAYHPEWIDVFDDRKNKIDNAEYKRLKGHNVEKVVT